MSFTPIPCATGEGDAAFVTNEGGADAVNIQDGGNSITTDSLTEYPEDSPHVSGDEGVFILAVRNDSLVPLTSTDGDYSPIAVDSSGRLVVSTLGSPGLQSEDSAHVSGQPGNFILGVRNDAIGTVFTSTDGDYSPIAVDGRGRVITSDNKVEDAAHVSGDTGSFVLGVRNDNGTTDLTTTNGDYSPIATDIKGRAITTTSGSNLSNGTETAVSAAAVPLAGAPANAARKGLIVQNVGVGDVRIGIAGVTATTGMKLLPGDSIVFTGGAVPINALFAIRSATTDSIVLAQELN